MKHVRMGRHGLRISRLALGTVNLGWLADDDESFAIFDRAVDAGINLFDTSDNYNAGASEETLGRWLATSGRRDEIVLATKVYSPPMKWSAKDPAERFGLNTRPNDQGLSARHIVAGCEASLRRLDTDRIDLYQMHHVDRRTPLEEIWQAMETLVHQGKILYVGTSNFAGWHLARACETARARHFLGPISEQSIYHLAQRTIELEVVPACEQYGLGLLTYSPLGAGLLAGGASGRRRRGARDNADDATRARLDSYDKLCAHRGLDPADVALAWVLAQPVVTAPIIGPRTLDQLEGSLRAYELPLDGDMLAELDRLFPGPGGQAPEAYAW
jgi:aryl-alcohol dehydrogenase-like predicted oxidoreductase